MTSLPVFASVLDSLQDVSSLAFGALAIAAAVPGARGTRPRMSTLELIGLIVSILVFAYLIVALLRPERF